MYQSGVRTNHSTNFSLAQLTDFALTGMDKQMYTSMILVNPQKAFDTLDYEVLLEKMKWFSFRTSVIKSFESYPSNRTFLVCIDAFSEAGTLKYGGSSQGSILGPLLFLLYVNDLFLLYVDDHCHTLAPISMLMTCFFYQHEDVKNTENVFNKAFSLLCQWFIDIQLSIHFGEEKTKSILFSKARSLREIDIFCGLFH